MRRLRASFSYRQSRHIDLQSCLRSWTRVVTRMCDCFFAAVMIPANKLPEDLRRDIPNRCWRRDARSLTWDLESSPSRDKDDVLDSSNADSSFLRSMPAVNMPPLMRRFAPNLPPLPLRLGLISPSSSASPGRSPTAPSMTPSIASSISRPRPAAAEYIPVEPRRLAPNFPPLNLLLRGRLVLFSPLSESPRFNATISILPLLFDLD